MKVAVLIMSTPVEPSSRNVAAMKRTFIALCESLAASGNISNEYDFFIYEGNTTSSGIGNIDVVRDPSFTHVNVYDVTIDIMESVYHTYEKTFRMFEYIKDQYDRIVRINISTYINIKLLDAALSDTDENVVYCNALNTYVNPESGYMNHLYPRGDFYMISNDTLNGILKYGRELIHCDFLSKSRIDVPHVDDCMIGIALFNYFNAVSYPYFVHYVMLRYNYFPSLEIKYEKFDTYSIASRLKTVPPTEKYSGYSWADNEWRTHDVDKMHLCNDIVAELVYDDIKLDDLAVKPENARPCAFIDIKSINPMDSKYLKYIETTIRKR